MGEDIPRPAANADFMALAKEEYEKKYPGKKWENLSESTRKSKYYKAMKDFEDRTGQPAYSQVPGNMKFKDYFLQMDEKQKSSWLGKRKYEMWKEGLVDLDKFIPPYPDRAFTVRELKERDKKSFDFIQVENNASDKIYNKLDFNSKKREKAVAFLKENIATEAHIDTMDYNTIQVLNTLFYDNMKKYGIEKFEKIYLDNRGVFGIKKDNKIISFSKDFIMAVNNPREFFVKNVIKYKKTRSDAFFMIDKEKNTIKYIIDHETGHAVYNKSLLKNKEAKLTVLFEKCKNESFWGINARKNKNEFFADAFAIYERGGILPKEVEVFIKEIIK